MYKRLQTRTERNKFTRMCISEAIVSLMKSSPLEDIRISAICKKSGISRMTFYHYYDSKKAALEDYLNEIIDQYTKESSLNSPSEDFHQFSHVLFALNFFDQYAEYILAMTSSGLHSVLLNGINQFVTDKYSKIFKDSMYELYFYAGALFNLFVKWQEGGKKDSAESIARILCPTD